MPWLKRLSEGLSKSRDALHVRLGDLLGRGPDLDAEFWEELEEALILSDVGVLASTEIVERLKAKATRLGLADSTAIVAHLVSSLADEFTEADGDLLCAPVTILMVGVNGSGKTTTIGKLAKMAVDQGSSVLLGSADTFRAAATEQLEIWAQRADVDLISRFQGGDPASVAFDTVAAANERGIDLTLIDTAGRLHTSADLMQELKKIQGVTRRKSIAPVRTLLVIDATTGQNGLTQAREFHAALDLDGVILTKLDGTARGGIAVAISRELRLPILKVGMGERIEDLSPFDSVQFAEALVGPVR